MEVITIIAVIFGPILAVQVEKYIARIREERNLKMQIFQVLMATRSIAGRVSYKHVDHLNLIDVVFKYGKKQNKKEKKVTDAWEKYCKSFDAFDHSKPNTVEASDTLFYQLLLYTAEDLGVKIDIERLKLIYYTPEAHTTRELDT